MNYPPSDELDELLCTVRVALEADLELERREVRPDFAATVAAAHARDPEAVPEQTVAAARALAPVVELRAHREDEGLDEASFEALLSDARTLAEADIAARRLAGIPSIPSPKLADDVGAPAPALASRRRPWVLAFAAVAVGFALLAPALWAWLDDSVRVEAGPKFEAEHSKAEDDQHHGARERLPKLEQVGPTHHSDRALHHGQPEPKPDTAAKTHRRRARAATTPAPAEAKPEAKAPSKAERAAELDREAQALWAAGDLEGAAALFTKITELGGSGAYLDLAYGDLFTLARQRGDAAAQLELWAAYLERLPEGRFADDARAGLCRQAKADDVDGCWRAYLRDFPEGVHRRAALRVLDSRQP